MTRMAAAEYRKIARAPKPSKYHAVAAYRCRACGCADDGSDRHIDNMPCIGGRGAHDPIRFASQAEARRYDVLRQEEALGFIKDLKLQVGYDVIIRGQKVCTYVADFTYYRGRDLVIEDIKGVRTPVFKLKKRLIEAHFGIKITEVAA